jgi:hypothetical protein
MGKRTRSTNVYVVRNGEPVPAEIVLQSETYTGLPIYDDGWPLGDDLPGSDSRSMWKEDRCAYCGDAWSPTSVLHADHIVPKSKGGANGPWNMAPVCKTCNWLKSDLLGQKTIDDRAGYFWDGTRGEASLNPRPRPKRAHDIKPNEHPLPKRRADHR